MTTAALKKVLDWMRTTDLEEVSYRRGEDAMTLRTEDAPPPQPALPGCSLVPVTSAEVGMFRFSKLGKARSAEKDSEVKEGQELGVVEAGGKDHPVVSPASGRIVSVPAEDGKAVEYGQPLFFIQPR